ncbi:hypothetical protein GOP47_0019446 [Adiantum capillus-veneris]|uniref:Uncharacterized protein n=1 Tax=Adiantum capillus-veneris TaxID=13818 RepID=A0A9D4Z9M2_ADICA|nr:hypothetical protein GOP47_0019446 [Adiantum capillus-veneris]
MALLCRRKGLFRYHLYSRLFSSCTGSPSPTQSLCTMAASPVLHNNCPSLAMVLSPHHFGLRRRFSAEATSYPTPAPPGDFEDFPDAGDGDYESGAEDDDPPPDPDDGALYSPSESEN